MANKRAAVLVGVVACVVMVGAMLVLQHSPARGATSSQRFPDVPVEHPYYVAINSMASLGYISGYPDGRFGPNSPVTRQQFAKMVVLTLGLPVAESDFPSVAAPFVDLGDDDPSSLYPHEYVALCAAYGIALGVDATHFDPSANIKRTQVVSMMVRAADGLAPGVLSAPPFGWSGMLSYEDAIHGNNVKRAEYNGLLAGLQGSGGSLSSWDTTGYATRGEVAQMLFNLWGKFQALEIRPTTTTTQPSTTTTTTKPTTTTTAPQGHHNFGEPAELNGLTITVWEPIMDPNVDFYVNDVESSTRKVFLVEVSIRNTSTKSLKYSRTDFVLVTSSHDFYDTFGYTSADVFHYPPIGSSQTLGAGEEKQGWLAFVVPNAAVADHVNHRNSSGKADSIWEHLD